MSVKGLLSKDLIMERLRDVFDPEIHMSIVELGLVYDVELTDAGAVIVTYTLTSPGCPEGPHIIHEIKKRLMEHPSVKGADVEVVWEPKWDPKIMASEECKEALGLW
jgi:metal-sulfur cluster biosynthetic enzyme